MKLTLASSVLASVLTLACLPAPADTNAAPMTTTTASATAPVSTKPVPYKGTITAVDATASTVTIQGAKSSMTLTVTPATKFKGGKALADFVVGDKVTGSYTKDASGTMSAYSLHKKK